MISTPTEPHAPLGLEVEDLPTAASARPSSARLWARVALACGLLVASAGLRHWQVRRVDATMTQGKHTPFPLKELPRVLGAWRETTDEGLDPQIAQAAGSIDSINRTYVDERTGVQLGVLVLYGAAADMRVHAPENCYPANGYTLADDPTGRDVGYDREGGAPGRAPFRALTFTKGEGARIDRQQVYYTWYYDGQWTPATLEQKRFERMPGMYKVHVARRAAPGEILDASNPCESFLKVLLPEMERRMARAQHSPARPAPSS